MNPIVPLYSTLQMFVQDRFEQVRERTDRGASGLEYGALIVLAALIIGILFSAINGTVRTSITQAITDLFNPGGAASN
jgi:Flp pilus assembly pilin Flp